MEVDTKWAGENQKMIFIDKYMIKNVHLIINKLIAIT